MLVVLEDLEKVANPESLEKVANQENLDVK